MSESERRRQELARSERAMRRAMAQAASVPLGYIVADVPGAVAAPVVAGQAFDVVYPEPIDIPPSSKKMKSNPFQCDLNPLGANATYLEKSCLEKGYGSTTETFGTVTDPNAVYIIHSTYCESAYVDAILGAMIRKVLKMGGQLVGDNVEEIASVAIDDAIGLRLSMTILNPLTLAQATVSPYLLPNNASLQTITNAWTQARSEIVNYLINASSNEIHKIALQTHSLINPTEIRTLAVLNLHNTNLMLYCQSDLTFQNRTKAALGSTEAADRIDNVPLACRTYGFKHSDIRLKAPTEHTGFSLTGASLETVRLIRAAQFTGSDNYQNRPPGHMFANLSQAYDTVVGPGSMKRSAISYKFNGKFINVMKQLRFINQATGLVNGVKGRAQMWVFEEVMRTSSANPVVVAYERSTKIGCVITQLPPVPMQSQLRINTEVSNNGP